MTTSGNGAGSALFDKVHGTLVGGAIGDAMGGATEMMHYETIQRVHGEITELVPYGDSAETARFDPQEPAGRYTDDTRLKHILCEALIASGGRIGADEYGRSWAQLMHGWFFTPVANAYYKIAAGTRPRDAGRGNMASNSTAMSIAPVGIVNACDARQAARDAYDVASVIHEGYALDAAVVVAAAVAASFVPGASVAEVVDASLAHLDAGAEMRELVGRGVDLAGKEPDYASFRAAFYEQMLLDWPQTDIQGSGEPLEGFYDTADPRETIPAVMGLFVLADGDPATSVLHAANFGRDSDTIGSIIGSIAGAYGGAARIPDDWKATVEAANRESQVELAQRMFAVLDAELARTRDLLATVESMR